MTALLEQIEADGIRLTVTESGEVRVAGKRSLVERWAPTLRDRKPDLMAALLARDHKVNMVNMVNVISCGDPAAHTMPPSESHSHFRLPDGCTLWVSPSESMEQVQARHPGAIPLPDSVTVTEPDTEAEQRAIEYCERVAKDREAGRVPVSYISTTHCRSCGTVPIFAGLPVLVDACPWCHNRTRGLPIPRPLVQCRECSHFTHDPIEDGGIGSCAKDGPPQGQMPAYPYVKRQCSDFEPKEPLQ